MSEQSIKQLDYVQLAVALGLRGAISGKEYKARCPFHDDTTPSFYMRVDDGVWICHTGCGKGDFYRLVELVLNCSPMEARAWITNNGMATNVEQLSKRMEEILNQPDTPTYVPEELGWKARYDALDNKAMPMWFLDRGFTWDTIMSWDIKYDHVNDSVIIPVYWQWELVGTVTRNTLPNLPKYQNSPGLPRSEVLFGRPAQGKINVILVEGLLDTIWLWQNGYNALGLLGSNISRKQVEILKFLKYGEVILGLDNDDAGKHGTIQVVTSLLKEGWIDPQIKYLQYPDGCKDAQDCTPEQLDNIMVNRKDIFSGQLL